VANPLHSNAKTRKKRERERERERKEQQCCSANDVSQEDRGTERQRKERAFILDEDHLAPRDARNSELIEAIRP